MVVFNKGDKVVYSGSMKGLHGATGTVIVVIGTHSLRDPRVMHWSYYVDLDNGQRLKDVRGRSLSLVN